MKFSPEFVDKVREANNISEILSQHTTLKNSGHNLMGLCPFPDHKEKTPSFSVSESKQVYYCFGCKKSGNTINFLMDYNGMSFVEAVEYLANRASIPLPEITYSNHNQKKINKTALLKINRYAGSFFKKSLADLPSDHIAKKYLAERGLTAEIIELFKLGFSLDSWNALTQYLLSLKAPLPLAENLGLLKKKSLKKEYYDLFRGRIMFPILSPSGDVLGFGGRTITNENPKYLNSSESPLFHKGKVLYGLHESAKHIRSEDSVILVEGYMDLLTLYQYGFKNVVATLGTAMTEDHAKLLKRFTKNILVLFDSDQAGQYAQERSLPILLSSGLFPKAISLGDSKDPDEFLRKNGAKALQEKISSSADLFLVVWSRISKGLKNDPTDTLRKVELISPYLNSLRDNSLKTLYLQEIASDLNVSLDWVSKALYKISSSENENRPLNKNSMQKTVPQEAHPTELNKKLNEKALGSTLERSGERSENKYEDDLKQITLTNPPKEEVFLVNLALAKREFMDELMEWGLQDKLSPSGLDVIFKKAIKEYRQNPANFAKLTSNLCSLMNNPSAISLHLDPSWESGLDVQKLKDDCLQRVKERFLNKTAKTLMADLRMDGDPEKLEQFMNVIRSRQALKQVKD